MPTDIDLYNLDPDIAYTAIGFLLRKNGTPYPLCLCKRCKFKYPVRLLFFDSNNKAATKFRNLCWVCDSKRKDWRTDFVRPYKNDLKGLLQYERDVGKVYEPSLPKFKEGFFEDEEDE